MLVYGDRHDRAKREKKKGEKRKVRHRPAGSRDVILVPPSRRTGFFFKNCNGKTEGGGKGGEGGKKESCLSCFQRKGGKEGERKKT